jgi:hypothetical protein
MKFVFDTSALVRLNSYYPDVFPAFWQNFNKAVTDGEVLSTREVLRELDREVEDHILTWAKDNARIFTVPTADQLNYVARILAIPHFQQLIGKKQQLAGTPVADPFVIAFAGVLGGTVVTEELKKPNAAKIPNVCESFGIPFVNLEGFMRAKGWVF